MKQAGIFPISVGRANAYLLAGAQGGVLVDTGTKGNEHTVLKALAAFGMAPGNVLLIILTHTHYDHCGSLKALKDLTGAKTLVHENEAARLRKGYGGFPKGTTALTRLISWLGRTVGRRIGGYDPVSPDITVHDRFELDPYGLKGHVLATPGHTAGSISIVLGDDAVVGDTAFNIFKKSLYPPFADDPEELLMSWKKLCDTGCDRFYPGHGRPFHRDRLRRNLEERRS